MKFADINKKFSEAVAKTLAEGYQICCNTMSGSQGEVANVNFISPEGEHYTLMLDHCSSLGSEGIWLDRLLLTWAKSNELKGDFNGRTNVTFWRGDKYVEVIGQQCYWQVSQNYFVDNAEEAKRISDVKRKHYRSGSSDDTYRFEFEMPMNGASRKLAAKLYREHKSRYQKLKISAADINSVKVCRYNHGTRHIEICTANEKVDFNVDISVKG